MQFVNPYQGCHKTGNNWRINSDVQRDRIEHFQRILPKKGSFQIIFNILIEKLYAESIRRNITNPDDFKQFVANSELTLPLGGTTSGNMSEKDE